MSQNEKDILLDKFLSRALTASEKSAFEELVRSDDSFAQEVAIRLTEADAFHRAFLAEKAVIKRGWRQKRRIRWGIWVIIGLIGVFVFVKLCGGGLGEIPDDETKKNDTLQGRFAIDSPPANINTGTPSNHTPSSSPDTIVSSPQRPPAYYIQVARDMYAPLKKIQTASEGNPPTPVIDEHQMAFQGYLDKDSAVVFAYYDRYPNDNRSIEWKARLLFEQGRYEEAALIFAQLKTKKKYEDIGAWNELLCYTAQYLREKKDFDRLEQKVRGTKYKEDLDRLLIQIR